MEDIQLNGWFTIHEFLIMYTGISTETKLRSKSKKLEKSEVTQEEKRWIINEKECDICIDVNNSWEKLLHGIINGGKGMMIYRREKKKHSSLGN